MKQFFCSVSAEMEEPGWDTAHRKIRSRVQRRVTLRRDHMLSIIISRLWGKNKSELFTREETTVGRHNNCLYVHNKAVAKKPICSYTFCHSTQKNKHRRNDACWTLLDRSRRSGCQEKLGNLVRLRWSLSKWPWHSCSSSCLEGGLDGFLRDLPTTSSCPPTFISWKERFGLMAKLLHRAACFLSIFAFSACHKITITISFFLPNWLVNEPTPCGWL